VPILRRWNTTAFTRQAIARIPPVVGVYVLMSRNNYPNYVGFTTNLRKRLLQHYASGDIPVSKFRAYQTSSRDEGVRLEIELIDTLQPRYNMLGR
jgi:excinuclease UvrABC nuclease subunit